MALGGSTNAIIHLIAMARPRRRALTLEDFDAISRAHAGAGEHPARRAVPDGGLLLRGRTARAAGASSRDLLAPRCPTVNGQDARREYRRRRGLQRRRHPPARQTRLPRGRPGRAARQPRARWRGHQAARRRAALLQHTRAARSCSTTTTTSPRASTIRRSTSTRLGARAAERGPARRAGMPEWGMLPIPKKLLEHGVRDMRAHLGRPHERHELRHLRAARVAGVGRRRSAGTRARRRPDRPRRRGAGDSTSTSSRPSSSAAAPRSCRPPRRVAARTASSMSST